uniref:NADH-ubiquinone oxidoreductase chain 6 n=1 Tax=Phalantus geniculatus TaxID=1524594 RepID=A0A6B9ITG0_9HEMI|nr:NADH dehydrogenase subunit 6 [Phalantus geniculatus]
MLVMIMMTLLLLSMLFPLMKHPLSMGFTLILQTIMIAMMTGVTINMFWFSYILIMIILSGMMVLFIYMASVASNEKFYPSFKIAIFMLLFLTLSSIMSMYINQMEASMKWPMKKESIMMDTEHLLTLNKMFNVHNMTITILVVSYLLLAMIVISNIVNIHEGPLRTKN